MEERSTKRRKSDTRRKSEIEGRTQPVKRVREVNLGEYTEKLREEHERLNRHCGNDKDDEDQANNLPEELVTPYLIPDKTQESKRYREVRDAMLRAAVEEGKLGTEVAVKMIK